MYVKQPTPSPSHVRLPDNYGGSAFSSSPYSDMPPPLRRPTPPKANAPAPEAPRLSDIPPKSSPFAKHMLEPHADESEPSISEEYSDMLVSSNDTSHAEPQVSHNKDNVSEQRTEQRNGSLLSSLIPNVCASKSFPFGHGIGGEELLILGIMLLVFLSGSETGEVDGEFIMLLGLLLFAG